MDKTILVIEDGDEEDIRAILMHYIKKEGFKVKEAENGIDGINILSNEKIDLMILDLMLPDIIGYDVCRKVSKEYKVPIIMLTARNDIVDKILGLELGEDDYITKPFDIREVIARTKVCLRRMESLVEVNDENIIKISRDIKINENSREVFKGGILLN